MSRKVRGSSSQGCLRGRRRRDARFTQLRRMVHEIFSTSVYHFLRNRYSLRDEIWLQVCLTEEILWYSLGSVRFLKGGHCCHSRNKNTSFSIGHWRQQQSDPRAHSRYKVNLACFTHFFRSFAPLFLAGFLEMLGVGKTCVKNDMHTPVQSPFVLGFDNQSQNLLWLADLLPPNFKSGQASIFERLCTWQKSGLK